MDDIRRDAAIAAACHIHNLLRHTDEPAHVVVSEISFIVEIAISEAIRLESEFKQLQGLLEPSAN